MVKKMSIGMNVKFVILYAVTKVTMIYIFLRANI